MKAMILAAGFGTRLLPYTLKRPKPLFPILNRPLLQLTAARINKAGFTQIVVNCHHLQQQITQKLKDKAGIILQKEDKILGTGGGLRMALPHFGQEPVLVVNGDIYHTIDYTDVYRRHGESNADVTLVLHDYPRFNDVSVNDRLEIAGFNKPGNNSGQKNDVLAFTGIHVINPEVLESIPQNTPFCIIDCYRKLLEKGGSIQAYQAKNHFWTDMGTPDDYLKLHAGLLSNRTPVYDELDDMIAEAPFVGIQNASTAKDVTLLDWACVGKHATIGAGATLQRSVIWDGAVIPAESVVKDTIVTA
ncbi:sugar phosphate nucleotidyltransferase [Thermodesulfobacteriota bacterium]